MAHHFREQCEEFKRKITRRRTIIRCKKGGVTVKNLLSTPRLQYRGLFQTKLYWKTPASHQVCRDLHRLGPVQAGRGHPQRGRFGECSAPCKTPSRDGSISAVDRQEFHGFAPLQRLIVYRNRRRGLSVARSTKVGVGGPKGQAGILLLCKEKLRRLSPASSDEVLIKARIVPGLDTAGELAFKGHGEKTVDEQQIVERFGQLGIWLDWGPLRKLTAHRNVLEHYRFSGSREELRDGGPVRHHDPTALRLPGNGPRRRA